MSLIGRLINEYDRLNTIDKENTGEWNAVFTSILFAPIVTTVYLIFALYLGPKLMKNRRPFQLLYLVQFYDLLQVVINTFLLILSVEYVWSRRDSIGCIKAEKPGTSDFEWTVNACWMTIASRMIDLLDTVFHVFRKKFSHITFLHIYHHALSFSVGWYTARYYPGGPASVFAVWNNFVHLSMYLYYFASANSSLRPYAVRYKKRITQLQLLQFITMLPYVLNIFADPNCHSYPKWLSLFGISQNVLMLYMFGSMYARRYYGKNKKRN